METNTSNSHWCNYNPGFLILILLALVGYHSELFAQDKFHLKYDSVLAEKMIFDGDYYILGSPWGSMADIAFTKINQNGTKIWTKLYNEPNYQIGQDLIRTEDGGFLILGNKRILNNSVFLVRTDPEGDTLWTRDIDIGFSAYATAGILATDGGFYITGYINITPYTSEILLLKTNASGETLWWKSFSGGLEYAYELLEDSSNGILISGYHLNESFDVTGILLKTGLNGDSLWTKKYEFPPNGSSMKNMIKTVDGGLALTGAWHGQPGIMKTTDQGDTVWTRNYDFSPYADEYLTEIRTIIQTSDGGFLVGGNSNGGGGRPASSTMGIFKTDSSGDLEWYRSYLPNEPYVDYPVGLSEQSGAYSIIAAAGLTGTSGLRTYLIKTDKYGCFTAEPQILGTEYFCAGDSTIISTTPGFSSFYWSNGKNSDTIVVTVVDDYWVEVTDTNGCPLWSDTLTITELPNPNIKVIAEPSSMICDGDSTQLIATITNLDPANEYSYSWTGNASSESEMNTSLPGSYPVIVEDKYGCIGSDSIQIRVQYPFRDEKICIVTTDQFTGQNLIVWEKTPDQGTKSYHIFREDDLIGIVPFDDLSVFTDTVADPQKRPYLYRITVVDTCGNESEPSPYHKPHFLQYAGSTGGVNLNWDEYEIEGEPLDFQSYSIYRGRDSLGTSILEENIPLEVNVYRDIDPAALDNRYYYRVAGSLNTPCYPSGGTKAGTGPYNHSLSNMDDNKKVITAINDFLNPGQLSIFPNPMNNSAIIQFSNPNNDSYQYSIRDLSGKMVLFRDNIIGDRIELNRGRLSSGLYLIELKGSETYRGKIIIE